jgi:D-alanine-D-alanine ligase
MFFVCMKKKIALVTGGYSGEATISYKSAITVKNNIDTQKFDVFYIDIHPQGWYCVQDDGNKIPINKEDFTLTLAEKKVVFDACLMCIHGTPGEDGKLQGYFDMLNLPYTSCDAATSALTFNKRYTVAVAAFGGIAVAKSLHLVKNHSFNIASISQHLKMPVFVKPNNGGSSIGMSKVYEPTDLAAAVEKAFKEDSQVLVEEFISGREFTIGVYKHNGLLTTLPITEIVTGNDFFDFEAKYQGKSEEFTPADIPIEIATKIELAAKKVYEILNCRGVVRIDFIYNEALNTPYMLEVNTVPGQSAASIIPQQVKAAGGNLKDFYTALIEDALG